MVNNNYSASDIKVLEGLEAVRKRPGMYIGSTDKYGLHHMVYEVSDNSVDEHMAGACNMIKVILNKDGSCVVEDDGRGMPVDAHPVYKKAAMEIIVTKLHAGGKFDNKSYAVSGGLHGVGISVVAALSKDMTVKVKKDGKIYMQSYVIGVPKADVKVIGSCDVKEHGTKVTFLPDDSIFSTTEFDYKTLATRFRETCFLNAGLKISFSDLRGESEKKEMFHYEGGLIEFVKWLNKTRKPIHTKPIYFKREENGTVAEVAIQYSDSYNENIQGFVNTINTIEGGTHVVGLKSALTRVINDYGTKKGILKKGQKLTGDDVREGVTAVISIKIAEPQFEGQTKTKLGNGEIKGIIDSMATAALQDFFEENPVVAKAIMLKSSAALKAREAAKRAKDLVRRKNALSVGSGLPGKLSDCSSKRRELTELYIVEGDSAGGTAKGGRDRETQAILPLRGKILNVEKSNASRALASEMISNMITAIGTSVGDQFDITKLRYNKIIIMSVDGEEATFVRNSSGEILFVKIGEFIDRCKKDNIDCSLYEVLCFGLKDKKTKFKKIKSVISHTIDEGMHEIVTSYGRSVKITSSHSVFVYEKNKIVLKKGDEIGQGDMIVAPKSLSLFREGESEGIDVLELLLKNAGSIREKVYVRGRSVEELLKKRVVERHKGNNKLIDKRIGIPNEIRSMIIRRRKEKGFSQKYICRKLGVKQPCVYYDWESGKNKPSLDLFKKYLKLLDLDEAEVMSKVKIKDSVLEKVWNSQYKNSGRNLVKDYVEFSDLSLEDIKELGDVRICPAHYANKGINRFIRIDKSLLGLIGFWLAEGSCSEQNGIRCSIGNNNGNLVEELIGSYYNIFGVEPKLSKSAQGCDELKLVNRVATLVWQSIFGFREYRSDNKVFPNIIFNVSKELQLEFLRMYFLGDGTLSKNNISFTTTSKDMANQLIYLLSSFGVVGSVSEKEPSENSLIKSRNRAYIVSVSSREDIMKLKKVWGSHKNSGHLDRKVESLHKSVNQKYKDISGDLIGLPVRSVKEVKASGGLVYDFSVEEDENFIAGFGGLCCHNTDADVDGQHIKALMLTLFYRYVPQLIEEGHIFVAVAPFYKIKKGMKEYYVYNSEELKAKSIELGGKLEVSRFKGLGEMNDEQLWDTTMNPKTRRLKQVSIEDGVEADETFSLLMGDAVAPRRAFIEENADKAEVDL
ncbi:MAG: helix-turn-helix domain-containing protein [Nanoarchaeota archaeon]|nr:helix-turn-helix domain-containing protein [Nanoarchaeota archaeon]